MERLLSLDVVPFMVLLLPLLGFTVLSLLGEMFKRDKEENWAGVIACTLVALAFAGSVFTAMNLREQAEANRQAVEQQKRDFAELNVQLKVDRKAAEAVRYEPNLNPDVAFISVGNLVLPFRLFLDALATTLMLVITGVGLLIHIYSLGYMAHDPERVRYFSYLNLFTFFMLLLVMGGSLPLMFVGWEGVGLCSYLLIGFWFKKESASNAGKKAFIVNRIGDAGLILGMALAFHAFGTLDFARLIDDTPVQYPSEKLGELGVITVTCLLLFLGACGKSAQIPLHTWLPDAMEGPTPVSALIHAATMVTAGVYMVSRLGPLYLKSETALLVIAIVGTATALMAATVALVQTDIKKVLAYSTVSQLGYMFLACGVGAFGVAVFHLFTHAFFKALLFLGSGSVIHALSGEQDLRKMGGLWKKIPWTHATFLVGTLAIAGIPPLAGFWSKDAILAAAFESHKMALFGVGMLTALLTAFYMWRLLTLTFYGEYRGSLETAPAHGHDAGHGHDDHGHGHGHGGIHESPPSMVMPLVLLALGSIGVGFIHIPELLGERAAHHPSWLPLVATFTAVAGIVLAWYCYLVYRDLPVRMAQVFAPLRRVFEGAWGFDAAYNWFASRVVFSGSEALLWKRLDTGIIDRMVNGAASLTAALAERTRTVQSGLVRAYALLILGGAVSLLAYLLWLPR
jgi:NADH-quinone oxidoreductase subunit L